MSNINIQAHTVQATHATRTKFYKITLLSVMVPRKYAAPRRVCITVSRWGRVGGTPQFKVQEDPDFVRAAKLYQEKHGRGYDFDGTLVSSRGLLNFDTDRGGLHGLLTGLLDRPEAALEVIKILQLDNLVDDDVGGPTERDATAAILQAQAEEAARREENPVWGSW